MKAILAGDSRKGVRVMSDWKSDSSGWSQPPQDGGAKDSFSGTADDGGSDSVQEHSSVSWFDRIKRADPEWKPIADETGNLPNMRYYFLLDAAIEWSEDQVVFRHGGSIDFFEMTELSDLRLNRLVTRSAAS